MDQNLSISKQINADALLKNDAWWSKNVVCEEGGRVNERCQPPPKQPNPLPQNGFDPLRSAVIRNNRSTTSHPETGAFLQYLRSLSSLCDALQENAHFSAFPKNNNESKKLLDLARQCLERIAVLDTDEQCHDDCKNSLEFISSSQDVQKAETIDEFTKAFPLKPESFSGTTEFSLINIPSSSLEMMPAVCLNMISEKKKKLSPLEMVQKENQQLMSAYKVRLSRTQNSRAQTNLNLSLQRRMAENNLLAQAKQKVFFQQNQERQERLLEQATRTIQKLACVESEEEETNKQLLARIFEYEQDEKWPLQLKENLSANPKNYSLINNIVKQTLSVRSHPLCQLRLKLQYRICNALITLLGTSCDSSLPSRVSRVNVALEPEKYDCNGKAEDFFNSRVMPETGNNNVERDCSPCIAETNDYISNELQEEATCVLEFDSIKNECENEKNESYETLLEIKEDLKLCKGIEGKPWFKLMEDKAVKRHLNNIVFDVRGGINKLVTMLILTYEHLNSPEGKDQCYAFIEEPFFKPMWSHLIRLFRIVYKDEEALMAKVMVNLSDITLSELGVSEKYWGDKTSPYEDAIFEIKNIVTCFEPLKKLEILVHVTRLVCENASNPTVSSSIGADDLIPMLCFVVIKSGLPELISECHAMEQFIHEGYLMGEEGYCLTSMRTVFQYLTTRI